MITLSWLVCFGVWQNAHSSKSCRTGHSTRPRQPAIVIVVASETPLWLWRFMCIFMCIYIYIDNEYILSIYYWWWIDDLVGGWALPLWSYEFVTWDDDIPNWMEKLIHMFQTTNRSGINQLCKLWGTTLYEIFHPLKGRESPIHLPFPSQCTQETSECSTARSPVSNVNLQCHYSISKKGTEQCSKSRNLIPWNSSWLRMGSL